MLLKQSNYNYIVKKNNIVLIANFISEAIACFEQNKFQIVQDILDSPNKLLSTEEKQIHNFLVENRFIIETSFNELYYLKITNRIARYGSNVLQFAIAPTMDCNFRCPYCYERRENNVLSDDVKTKIIDYARLHLPSKSKMNVAWFGGEPLLQLDIIEAMANNFNEICAKLGKEYHSKMITNGYLLNNKNLPKILNSNISEIQITLDGTREQHDQRRFLVGGAKTYDTILDNMELILPHLEKLNIRVNIDKRNLTDDLYILIDELAKRYHNYTYKIKLGFYPVDPNESYKKDQCYSFSTLSEEVKKLYTYAGKKGFNLAKSKLFGIVYCSACQINNFIIDPNGNLFLCLEDTGKIENRVGTLGENGNIEYHMSNYLAWTAQEVFDHDECVKCKFLPYCMGGCLKKPIKDRENKCGEKLFIEEKILDKFYKIFDEIPS